MLRSLLPLLALLSLPASLRADDIRRIALDGSTQLTIADDVMSPDGLARIRKVEQPALELYPAASKPTRGTILVSPGGGYAALAITHEGREVARMLNEKGWDVAVLIYHIGPGDQTRPLALEDAKSAFRLVQKRGAEFSLNTSRVGVMGFSAGGHLTARLGHETAGDQPPAFSILMYPAYLGADKLLPEVSPLAAPTFIYVAADDKLVTGARSYAAACEAAKIRHELHVPEKGGHGFGLKPGRAPEVQDWPATLGKFLDSLDAK